MGEVDRVLVELADKVDAIRGRYNRLAAAIRADIKARRALCTILEEALEEEYK